MCIENKYRVVQLCVYKNLKLLWTLEQTSMNVVRMVKSARTKMFQEKLTNARTTLL